MTALIHPIDQSIWQISEALCPGGWVIISMPYWSYLNNIALAFTIRTDLALTTLRDGGHINHFSCKHLFS